MVRVKICGITTREGAWSAIELGADAVGFLVGLAYGSEDELTAAEAGKIVQSLPPYVGTTLVTHRARPADVITLCTEVRAQVVQLHGPYPVERIPELREAFPAVKIVKTVHAAPDTGVHAAVEASRFADAILVDTETSTRLGGTGFTHDWALSPRIRDEIAPIPMILAGGLRPDNVARAIEQVRPYGVDVNSGVSLRRGQKSSGLIADFLRAARGATA